MKMSEGKIWWITGATSLKPAWAEASANAAPIPEVAPVFPHILPSDLFIAPMSRHQVVSDMASRQRHVCFTPMCGRLRVGKNFLHVCSIGRCAHVFGLLARFT